MLLLLHAVSEDVHTSWKCFIYIVYNHHMETSVINEINVQLKYCNPHHLRAELGAMYQTIHKCLENRCNPSKNIQ